MFPVKNEIFWLTESFVGLLILLSFLMVSDRFIGF